MACDPEILKHVPLFSLLDDDEAAILAAQVELQQFAVRQRIYKVGDPGGRAYVMISGRVRVSTVDEDQQEVVIDEPAAGEFFGFASMLDGTPHQTNVIALEECTCVEIDRDDIAVLIEKNRTPAWTFSPCLDASFTPRTIWCACAAAAIRTI